ncbi:MAG: transposase [Desulfotomaculaceae bacterium]|nr:transposase [Desulfotomaculaceae bacterium]MDD4766701.1 transposase [Desulfotomaculaceae bacterium]
MVDRSGFPLEIQSFEGNRAEFKTIVPVLAGFKERHGLSGITVTADAAMLSAGNIEVLERLGYHYIIGSKLAKTPYEIEAHLSGDEDFEDGQIFESRKTVTIDGKRTKRREIFQYRRKRAALDLSNIDKTVAKAQKIIDKKADIKRNRFLKITGDKRGTNLALVEKARRRAGIKGYITDLGIPAQQVIDAYHQLFPGRKIFPHVEVRPKGQKKFVRTLEPVRTGLVSVGSDTFELKPEFQMRLRRLSRDCHPVKVCTNSVKSGEPIYATDLKIIGKVIGLVRKIH